MSVRQYKILKFTIKDINYLKVLLIAAITTIVIFAPFVIINKGIYLFYGDYNVQQIPFWQLCHDAVRNGDVFWNWNTDLGTPFIGSYSFYVIGSPFFWLTLPFPNSWLPYLMTPLFIIKFSTAAVLAYAYIKRFVKNLNYAVIGALLYAFVSFNIYNIFFNHFIDVAAIFPLVLIGMEECIVNNRKYVFAISVALCAVTNYFFFVGQVVFLILYFILRCMSDDFKVNIKKFLSLCFEAVLGVMMAAFILLPSFFALMGNYRTLDFLMGRDIILYDRIQRYAHIFQSAFMIPDMPSIINAFPDSGSTWASISAYFPLFGMAGVIAFFKDRKRHWLRRLIIISIITAFIPFLNSLFFALNWAYYARWFYMPILVMALATAMSLDYKKVSLKSGFIWCIGLSSMFTLVGLIPANENGELKFFTIHSEPLLFFGSILIAVVSAVVGLIIFNKYRNNPVKYAKISLIAVIAAIIICSYLQLGQGLPTWNEETNSFYNYAYEEVVVDGLETKNKINLPDPKENFYRVDIANESENQPMMWGLPAIQTFHSVVSPSIMNFYPEVDVERDVSSRPELKLYGLRGLFSVKYLFIERDYPPEDDMPPGFEFYKSAGNFDIYQNDYFIPPGFTFDYYIDEKTFDDTYISDRHLVLNKALLLTKEQTEKYADIIQPHPQLIDRDIYEFEEQRTTNLDLTYEEEYIEDCENAMLEASSQFTYDNKGFTSKINLTAPKLVFYSVPYDRGWSATVNGEEVDIERVNIGFMAVAAKQGENIIRFDYEPPGLDLGLTLGLIGLMWLFVYPIEIFQIKISVKKEKSVHEK